MLKDGGDATQRGRTRPRAGVLDDRAGDREDRPRYRHGERHVEGARNQVGQLDQRGRDVESDDVGLDRCCSGGLGRATTPRGPTGIGDHLTVKTCGPSAVVAVTRTSKRPGNAAPFSVIVPLKVEHRG